MDLFSFNNAFSLVNSINEPSYMVIFQTTQETKNFQFTDLYVKRDMKLRRDRVIL